MNPNPNPSTALRPRLLGWLMLAVVATIVAQSSTQQLEQAEATEPGYASVARFRLAHREGKWYRPGGTVPFTGWVTDHFVGGPVKLRSAMVDGRLHGESTSWFANGVVELREHFQRGLPDGVRATFYANGQPRSVGRLAAGRQQGIYRQWHENGKLAVEAEFSEGKPHGLSRAWYPNGSLKAEALMSHGEVQARHAYPDGTRWEPTLLAGARIP
ncbi:MAG: toxin-antitoxin system YwqK family antitoxin [Proteobacteria bacterium]|nr:toxin-antitoxin system YwqK family antitoxin [Pseudomonadota bacterium]